MPYARPRPVPLLFFLCGFFLTVGLGTWQVQRLHWKENLIHEIETAHQQPPMTTLPKDEAGLAAKNFYPVKLSGTWLNTEFDLAPRYFNSKFGYTLVTPLRLDDGRVIFVSRGWVPAEKKDPKTRPETKVSGHAVVNGILRIGRERGAFTPKNSAAENIWFGRDWDQMGDAAHVTHVIPATVDETGVQDIHHLPVPSDGTIRLRNAHLSYIITWYGIALGILVIFLTYHHEKPRKHGKKPRR